MVLLEARNLSCSFGDRTLFENLSLAINEGDKIGLIGTNGVGKSTLLRQLAGIDASPTSEFLTSNQLVMEYLPQNQPMDDDRTVLEQIFHGTSPLLEIVRRYENALEAVTRQPEDAAATQTLLEMQEEMDQHDAWQLESNAKSILHRLGIDDISQKIGTLSGGMKKRVALAAALIRPANLLLLDEPTNHLDYETIRWLENELHERKCAFVIVTHDRYFLDRTTNTILELDHGQLWRYSGNYSTYLEEKAIQEANASRHQEKLRKLYKQELAWMRKGVEARRTKQKARKERFAELEGQLATTNETDMKMDFVNARLGKKIIDCEHLSKSYGEAPIFRDFSHAFVRTDRIGIVGPNGIGKTTLLDVLAGLTQADGGTLEIGKTVKIGYYKQQNQDLPPDQKVIDFLRDHGEYIHRADGSHLSASQMLEAFRFRPDQQHGPIRNLSGGECRRLYLLSILMEQNNVLFLDEPTNDLDIGTLQVLEDYLEHFPGPIVTVSHDRYFLDRIATSILAFEGDGALKLYAGDFSSYLDKRPEPVSKKEPSQKKEAPARPKATPKLKFTYKEQQEYDHIEEDIAFLEAQIDRLEAAMVENATQYSKLVALTEERDALASDLDAKMTRWAELEEKHEQILSQKK
ncbi:MAG: ABC-F family ATP-binding cassette domain-containing protein [Peptococcaceae bacterium]|nr:ABC-F family ATP-binding cassette domain-containing protein [Peptococcaceae bacterium]